MLSDTEDDLPRLERERMAAYRSYLSLDTRVRNLQSRQSSRLQAEREAWMNSQNGIKETPNADT